MISLPQLRFTPAPQQVVAAVHTWPGLEKARRLAPGAVDLVEIRLDALAAGPEEQRRLEKALGKIATPLLITARDPREGGANALPWSRRQELLRALLPRAVALDLELRNAERGRAVMAAARAEGCAVVLSAHDFRRMPALAKLREMARAARQSGADVFKFAGMTEHFSQFAVLGHWLASERERSPFPLAAMGMGAWGKISRLALAQGGSVLNYGYLDAANASGQWPAPLLKTRLQEL